LISPAVDGQLISGRYPTNEKREFAREVIAPERATSGVSAAVYFSVREPNRTERRHDDSSSETRGFAGTSTTVCGFRTAAIARTTRVADSRGRENPKAGKLSSVFSVDGLLRSGAETNVIEFRF